MGNQPDAAARGWMKSIGQALGAAVAFTLAYSISWGGFFMIGFLACLVSLAKFGTTRQAFYLGLAVGMLIYPVQLFCFYTIFGVAAVVFWLILSLLLALFLLLASLCFARLNPVVAAVVIPFLWTGLEYFRSELYCLRFSWVTVGYAFSGWRVLPFQLLGVYGAGFLMAAYAVILVSVRRKWLAVAVVLLTAALLALCVPSNLDSGGSSSRVHIAGVQLESPSENQVLILMNQLAREFPQTELFVFSEYTFDEPVPDRIRAWCREHRRYFIAGGQDPATNGNYFNTAFVVGTNGDVVFKQVKCVPVQFFKDGLPALEQNLWASPWGKIGICICYDLSYARVTDRLIRLGAQALIVPTGDISDWGRREHELHSRVAPVRAAEYGVPIFRVCGSGISQWVDRIGKVRASAPFPGELATISGVLEFRDPGTLPIDRLLAPFSVFVTVLVVGGLAFVAIQRRPRNKGSEQKSTTTGSARAS